MSCNEFHEQCAMNVMLPAFVYLGLEMALTNYNSWNISHRTKSVSGSLALKAPIRGPLQIRTLHVSPLHPLLTTKDEPHKRWCNQMSYHVHIIVKCVITHWHSYCYRTLQSQQQQAHVRACMVQIRLVPLVIEGQEFEADMKNLDKLVKLVFNKIKARCW